MKAGASVLTLMMIVVFPFTAISHGVKKKGAITDDAGNTITGWINYRNWDKNPKTIELYQDSLSGSATTYHVSSIRSVNIFGLDHYQKAIIAKDARPVALSELLPPETDSFITDTVLLRTIVEGSRFTLFELVDFKSHYFIQQAGGELTELKYRRSLKEGNEILTERQYIIQLKVLLSNLQSSSALLQKIDNASYSEKGLKKIITEMNTLNGSDVLYTAGQASSKILTRFFAGTGIGFSSLRVSGDYQPFSNMKFESAFMPGVSIGVDIAAARNLQDIVLRAELVYNTVSYTGKGSRYYSTGGSVTAQTTYVVQQNNISPTLSLHYNFVRKENLRVYAGAGVAYSFSFYSKNIYTEEKSPADIKETKDYIDYPGGWLNISGQLGLTIGNKYEVGVNALFAGTFTNYSLWGLTPNTYSAHLRYFF